MGLLKCRKKRENDPRFDKIQYRIIVCDQCDPVLSPLIIGSLPYLETYHKINRAMESR